MTSPYDVAYLAGYADGADSEKETVTYLYRQVMIARGIVVATLTAVLLALYLYYRKGTSDAIATPSR